MGTFPLPAPLTVAPFDPGPPSDSYSKIFADTMGNLATPDDGFDDALFSAGQITDAGQAFLAPGDQNILDASAAADTFATADEAQLLIDGQAASDAVDASMSDFSTAIPPAVAPGNPNLTNGNNPPPAPTCPNTSISTPADGCIGVVAPGGTMLQPGDAPEVIDNYGYDPTTNLASMGAYFIQGFGGSDNVTAAQLVSVSGGRVVVTLASIFQGGAIQKNVAYLQFALDPAASFFSGMIQFQINNLPAWHGIQYQFTPV